MDNKQYTYKDLKKLLLSGSWKDSRSNVLTFLNNSNTNDPKTDALILMIDGADCSEGVEEVVDCDMGDIISSLEWYGYDELKKLLVKALNG